MWTWLVVYKGKGERRQGLRSLDILYEMGYLVRWEVGGEMRQRISVSEAQANLSGLLKRLQQEPQAVFEITVNGLVLGELRAAEINRLHIQPGEALLQALEEMGESEIPAPKDRSVAREHDAYLYTR